MDRNLVRNWRAGKCSRGYWHGGATAVLALLSFCSVTRRIAADLSAIGGLFWCDLFPYRHVECV
jgi:hypothetical protein